MWRSRRGLHSSAGRAIRSQQQRPASGAQRFYFFRGFSGFAQNNRLLADLGSTVNDITPPSGNTVLFTKSAGAQRAAFQAVGNTCYIGDGVDLKKYMLAGLTWQANTVYQLGNLIIDPNGNVQVVESLLTSNIIGVQVLKVGGTWYAVVTFRSQVTWAAATNVTFANLLGYVGLNGATIAVATVVGLGLNANQAAFALGGTPASYGPTPDVGTGTSQPGATQGKSGGGAPAWNAALGGYTTDGNLVWRNFGSQVSPWGIAAPTFPPSVVQSQLLRNWQPNLAYLNAGGSPEIATAIIDSNGNVELLPLTAGQFAQSGPSEPLWSQITPSSTTSAGTTQDGSALWYNGGPVRSWVAALQMYAYQTILDSNGNLQVCTTPGTTGAGPLPPTWATVQGTTTADNTVTWTCLGPGVTLLTSVRQYAAAYHTTSGQVSTISDLIPLNPTGYTIGPQGALLATLSGTIPARADIDAVWIFATPQGTSTPLLLGSVPNPIPGTLTAWTFYDQFPDSFLDAEVSGPQNESNNPPPAGFMPIGFHLGLVCGFVNNVLFYSSGTTAVGNPNESFAPLNNFQLPSAIVGGWSTSIGLIILRIDGISIMLGSNTANSPLYVVNIFDGVGLASRDAFATRGNRLFMMSTTGKVLAFSTSQFISAIEGQGDVGQATPDSEIGFPIGDLLAELNPADAYVVWYEGPSSDSGLFVSDGSTGWYMMRNLNTPEQAAPWSPFATITGGLSAIAAVQTSPGINSLIVGTPGGPIWKRDLTTNADAGTAYAASADIAPVVLAQPGTTCTVRVHRDRREEDRERNRGNGGRPL